MKINEDIAEGIVIECGDCRFAKAISKDGKTSEWVMIAKAENFSEEDY